MEQFAPTVGTHREDPTCDYFNNKNTASDYDSIDLSSNSSASTKPVQEVCTARSQIASKSNCEEVDTLVNHFQANYLATIAPRGEKVTVALGNASTWQKFHRQNTEMIVTKIGRRMFPSLTLDISGLEPDRHYEIYATLMLADRHTMKYQRGVWLTSGPAEVYPPPGCTAGLTYNHPDSPASGKHWLRQEVSFMRLKLTNKLDLFSNDPSRTGSMIFAYSMHKYLPVIHVRELTGSQGSGFYTAVTFAGTEFIAVTAYQNPELTDLKIQFNPYAKGIRNQGDRMGPLMIDSFRPTIQALQEQQQQQQQQQEQVKQERKPTKLSKLSPSSAEPPSLEFGSYLSQTDASFGPCSMGRRQQSVSSTTSSASERRRPYNAHLPIASRRQIAASPPAPPMQPLLQFSTPAKDEELPAAKVEAAVLSEADHSNDLSEPSPLHPMLPPLPSYNPYSWYFPQHSVAAHQHYYEQYQQVYQQYYPPGGHYYAALPYQPHQQVNSHLAAAAPDSSPSGVSFEHAD